MKKKNMININSQVSQARSYVAIEKRNDAINNVSRVEAGATAEGSYKDYVTGVQEEGAQSWDDQQELSGGLQK